MQAEQEFFVGIQDVGTNNEMTNKAILEALTNATNVHGNLVGQGISNKNISHISWVVLNWKLEVYQRPKICETILVKTWGQEYSGIRAFRDYDIFNQQGELLAKATSMWIALNTETGKPIRLTEDMMAVYESEPQHKNFPNFKFSQVVPKDFPIISKIRFKINKSMIDCNHHVHNPSYMDLVNEVLPEGLEENHFCNVEVHYKKEIILHEEVLVEYAIAAEKHYVFIWDESKSILHSTIVMY